MQAPSQIRSLVSQALTIRRLTRDLEQAISSELSRLGYLPDGDEEVLELLMAEMDAGRIQIVHSR